MHDIFFDKDGFKFQTLLFQNLLRYTYYTLRGWNKEPHHTVFFMQWSAVHCMENRDSIVGKYLYRLDLVGVL